ncbi:MAG: hypothetical protein ABI904_03965 [Chloroflexota bacterium]
MNQRLIVIDGKTYKSVDEMPEDVRRNYENAMRNLDKNQNGMPDALEGMASIPDSITNVLNAAKIIVNGQSYAGIDQLPPEIRAKYEQALGTMDANKNGIPDFVDGMLRTPNQTNAVATSFGTQSPPRSQPVPVASSIEPESSGGWMLALTGILFIGLCVVAAGAGVWYFYFR